MQAFELVARQRHKSVRNRGNVVNPPNPPTCYDIVSVWRLLGEELCVPMPLKGINWPLGKEKPM